MIVAMPWCLQCHIWLLSILFGQCFRLSLSLSQRLRLSPHLHLIHRIVGTTFGIKCLKDPTRLRDKAWRISM